MIKRPAPGRIPKMENGLSFEMSRKHQSKMTNLGNNSRSTFFFCSPPWNFGHHHLPLQPLSLNFNMGTTQSQVEVDIEPFDSHPDVERVYEPRVDFSPLSVITHQRHIALYFELFDSHITALISQNMSDSARAVWNSQKSREISQIYAKFRIGDRNRESKLGLPESALLFRSLRAHIHLSNFDETVWSRRFGQKREELVQLSQEVFPLLFQHMMSPELRFSRGKVENGMRAIIMACFAIMLRECRDAGTSLDWAGRFGLLFNLKVLQQWFEELDLSDSLLTSAYALVIFEYQLSFGPLPTSMFCEMLQKLLPSETEIPSALGAWLSSFLFYAVAAWGLVKQDVAKSRLLLDKSMDPIDIAQVLPILVRTSVGLHGQHQKLMNHALCHALWACYYLRCGVDYDEKVRNASFRICVEAFHLSTDLTSESDRHVLIWSIGAMASICSASGNHFVVENEKLLESVLVPLWDFIVPKTTDCFTRALSQTALSFMNLVLVDLPRRIVKAVAAPSEPVDLVSEKHTQEAVKHDEYQMSEETIHRIGGEAIFAEGALVSICCCQLLRKLVPSLFCFTIEFNANVHEDIESLRLWLLEHCPAGLTAPVSLCIPIATPVVAPNIDSSSRQTREHQVDKPGLNPKPTLYQFWEELRKQMGGEQRFKFSAQLLPTFFSTFVPRAANALLSTIDLLISNQVSCEGVRILLQPVIEAAHDGDEVSADFSQLELVWDSCSPSFTDIGPNHILPMNFITLVRIFGVQPSVALEMLDGLALRKTHGDIGDLQIPSDDIFFNLQTPNAWYNESLRPILKRFTDGPITEIAEARVALKALLRDTFVYPLLEDPHLHIHPLNKLRARYLELVQNALGDHALLDQCLKYRWSKLENPFLHSRALQSSYTPVLNAAPFYHKYVALDGTYEEMEEQIEEQLQAVVDCEACYKLYFYLDSFDTSEVIKELDSNPHPMQFCSELETGGLLCFWRDLKSALLMAEEPKPHVRGKKLKPYRALLCAIVPKESIANELCAVLWPPTASLQRENWETPQETREFELSGRSLSGWNIFGHSEDTAKDMRFVYGPEDRQPLWHRVCTDRLKGGIDRTGLLRHLETGKIPILAPWMLDYYISDGPGSLHVCRFDEYEQARTKTTPRKNRSPVSQNTSRADIPMDDPRPGKRRNIGKGDSEDADEVPKEAKKISPRKSRTSSVQSDEIERSESKGAPGWLGELFAVGDQGHGSRESSQGTISPRSDSTSPSHAANEPHHSTPISLTGIASGFGVTQINIGESTSASTTPSAHQHLPFDPSHYPELRIMPLTEVLDKKPNGEFIEAVLATRQQLRWSQCNSIVILVPSQIPPRDLKWKDHGLISNADLLESEIQSALSKEEEYSFEPTGPMPSQTPEGYHSRTQDEMLLF